MRLAPPCTRILISARCVCDAGLRVKALYRVPHSMGRDQTQRFQDAMAIVEKFGKPDLFANDVQPSVAGNPA
jgi:hypothetical protein